MKPKLPVEKRMAEDPDYLWDEWRDENRAIRIALVICLAIYGGFALILAIALFA